MSVLSSLFRAASIYSWLFILGGVRKAPVYLCRTLLPFAHRFPESLGDIDPGFIGFPPALVRTGFGLRPLTGLPVRIIKLPGLLLGSPAIERPHVSHGRDDTGPRLPVFELYPFPFLAP